MGTIEISEEKKMEPIGIDFLQAIKEKYKFTSDYKMALALEMTSAGLYLLVHRKTTIGEKNALKIAKMLDISPAEVLVCSNIERAKNPVLKKAWKEIYKTMKKDFRKPTRQKQTANTGGTKGSDNRLIIMSNKKCN